MTKRFTVVTHGCKLNQFESAAISTKLSNIGIVYTEDYKSADIVIFNSCTVTNTADKKAIKFIRQIERLKNNKDIIFIVTGCLAQTDREKILGMNGINLIVDNKLKHKIPEFVDYYLKNGVFETGKVKVTRSDRFEFEPESFPGRTRAFLKIQDGCNRMCSFCKVPFARGGSISLETDEIIRRFKRLLDLGYKEIVLTGVNITSYYWSGNTLKDLIKLILDVKGEYRIRLSSIMPDEFDTEILEFTKDGKLSPHLHISIQSGSDRIIKMMKRHYTSSDVIKIAEKARKYVSDFGFSGDVIVGFPGESEEDFQNTIKTVRNVGFFRLHIFPFSPRKGTPASAFPDQVDYNTKKEREHILTEVVKELSTKFKTNFLGKKLRILPEEYCEEGVYGYADNYLRVLSKNPTLKRNEFSYVEITDINKDDVTTVISS
ncbi:MAG: tRNA (N(6)-L-threonylcarbamoyladenosine(37)-C(2))-methylthiotransferase MtaB [Brevinematales bacterium]|nr:tRNA (N(6)-L-threonylcarbamoyladenosine(37)-C(2))-methylthiotransferase MtaB [Brevinematales bacterium]